MWDFCGIPKTEWLGFPQDKKTRMFKKYNKKLVLKFCGGKGISFFFFLIIVWKLLFEMFWLSAVPYVFLLAIFVRE